jgi:hypothetical protein
MGRGRPSGGSMLPLRPQRPYATRKCGAGPEDALLHPPRSLAGASAHAPHGKCQRDQ